MAGIPYYIALAIFAAAVAIWAVMLRYLLIVGKEFWRIKQSGGLPYVPYAHRGLPFEIVFMNLLPRVERERRILVLAILAFLGLSGALGLLILAYGPHR